MLRLREVAPDGRFGLNGLCFNGLRGYCQISEGEGVGQSLKILLQMCECIWFEELNVDLSLVEILVHGQAVDKFIQFLFLLNIVVAFISCDISPPHKHLVICSISFFRKTGSIGPIPNTLASNRLYWSVGCVVETNDVSLKQSVPFNFVLLFETTLTIIRVSGSEIPKITVIHQTEKKIFITRKGRKIYKGKKIKMMTLELWQDSLSVRVLGVLSILGVDLILNTYSILKFELENNYIFNLENNRITAQLLHTSFIAHGEKNKENLVEPQRKITMKQIYLVTFEASWEILLSLRLNGRLATTITSGDSSLESLNWMEQLFFEVLDAFTQFERRLERTNEGKGMQSSFNTLNAGMLLASKQHQGSSACSSTVVSFQAPFILDLCT
ncbi:hypothetical protein VP01_1822g2 [Puccinia sorghi]|uniref:Uncharacterized protein n=1 Tax=Puccinia sorghi TaxID=27349 RepID=A0A0L6VE04_9BASI|nr:hypothetical protein VP01_1822g2 [Puccinia sorghi]